MRTTIDIPEELFRAAKTKAAAEGRTLRELMLEGLGQIVHKPPAGAKKRLKRTQFPIVEGKKSRRVVTNEVVQKALEDFYDEEARYYAELVRR
jgi:hypothetical protein